MTRLYRSDADSRNWGFSPTPLSAPGFTVTRLPEEQGGLNGKGTPGAAVPSHRPGASRVEVSPASLLAGQGKAGFKSPAASPTSPTHPEPIAQLASPLVALPEAPEAEFPPVPTGFWPVLQNANFLKLWAGQVFSQLADKVYLVLIIALITRQFQTADQSVSGWVSSVMIAFTIPAVLFGSLAGVFVDRWPKKQILVLTNLLRGGLVLLLPLLLWLSREGGALAHVPLGFWVLLGVTFLISTLTQFFAPAEQVAMPLLVPRQHLLSANSLYTLTMMAAVIVGFAAGDPLLAIADRVMLYVGGPLGIGRELLVGGSYAIAGLLLMLLRTEEQREPFQPKEQPHLWQDIREGLDYLQQQKRVRGAMIQLVILFAVFAALAVLMVRLAELLPEITAAQFGLLLAAGGLGMVIGVGILGQLGQRCSHQQLSLYGSLGLGLSLGCLSLFTQHLWPVLLLLTGLGASAALVGIPMQTTIQEETPEALRGKIFGLQNNAVNIALSLPLALAGVAETFWGLQTVLIALGVTVITGGILTWYISRTGCCAMDHKIKTPT